MTKVPEVMEGYALLILDPLEQALQKDIILIRGQVCVPQQDFGKVQFANDTVALGELVELQLEHLRLQVVHEAVEVVIVDHPSAPFPEEVQLQGGGHHMTTLQSLAIVYIALLEKIEGIKD